MAEVYDQREGLYAAQQEEKRRAANAARPGPAKSKAVSLSDLVADVRLQDQLCLRVLDGPPQDRLREQVRLEYHRVETMERLRQWLTAQGMTP